MNRFLIFTGCLWFASLLAGFGAWTEYEHRAGPIGPRAAAPSLEAPRAELILFVHPHCPCARSALELLARESPPANSCRIRAIFVAPADTADEWYAGRNAELAMSISGATIERDPGGNLAKRYGARTSGYAVVISVTGEIRFRGGLLPNRMAKAERRKLPFVWDAILRGEQEPITKPVFGCPLFDEE